MLSEPEQCARLILLRHPHLSDPYRSMAVGQGAAELSRRGRQHTLALMRSLNGIKIDRIYAAPVPHCREVAEALSRDRGIEVQLEPRMLDQHLGEWQGLAWEEVRRSHEALVRDFFSDYGLVAPPSGETLDIAVNRMLSWWKEVAAEVEEKAVLIVSAAPILSGFSARLLGLSIRRAPALSLPPAAYGVLDVYRDGAVIRCWHPLCLSDELP